MANRHDGRRHASGSPRFVGRAAAVDRLSEGEVKSKFYTINDQMKSIEGRVDGIMQELNVAVVESKKLYEKKITELGEEYQRLVKLYRRFLNLRNAYIPNILASTKKVEFTSIS